MENGVPELESGNKNLVAFPYEVHDAPPFRFIRRYHRGDNDIGLVAALVAGGKIEFRRGFLAERDLRIWENIFQVVVGDGCPIWDLVLPPQAYAPVELLFIEPAAGQDQQQGQPYPFISL